MSSPLNILLSCALLLLTACGFQPLYGDAALQATRTPLQGNMVIETSGAREGQILKGALEDRLNPEGIKFASPDYRLHVSISKNLIPAVVKSDGTIQRYDVRLDTNFQLYKSGNLTPIYSGALRRTGSYNVTVNAEFATFEAERDVVERTLEEIAEDYVLRLTGYFAEKPKEEPDVKPAAKPATPSL